MSAAARVHWLSQPSRSFLRHPPPPRVTSASRRSASSLPQSSLSRKTSHRTGLAPTTPDGFSSALAARLRKVRSIRFSSSGPRSSPPLQSAQAEAPPSLSQRLKKLSQEYGWSALGVYLGLSALDFPFCFLAVRMLGTERIGYAEHAVVETFWSIVRIPFPNLGKKAEKEEKQAIEEEHQDAAAAAEPAGSMAQADGSGAVAAPAAESASEYFQENCRYAVR